MDTPFYELSMDDHESGWQLEILRDNHGQTHHKYDWGNLTWGRKVDLSAPLHIGIGEPGERLGISFANAMVPVLSSQAADIVRSAAGEEIELIPARIVSETESYFVMNILSVVRCVDEKNTEYLRKWTPGFARPDRVGDYRTLLGIAIDPAAARGHNLFRIEGSVNRIIASEAVKGALEKSCVTGIKFELAYPRWKSE